MSLLDSAKEAGQIDASVVGAALQTCGFQRWWDALLEVHRRWFKEGLGFDDGIGTRLFLSALARCAKDKTLDRAVLVARGEHALKLGKQAWKGMPELTSEVAFCSALGGAWSICDAAGSEGALQWADELHAWSKQQSFMPTAQTCTPFLSLLEQRAQHHRVDSLLSNMFSKRMLDEVLLAGLVGSAGQTFQWQRVDRLWLRFTQRYKVKPNAICYVTYARAHLLSGRPARAIEILQAYDDLQVIGVEEAAGNAAIIYLQALLIVYHSGLGGPAKNQMSEYLKLKRGFISSQPTAQMKAQWQKLYTTSERLIAKPRSLLLHDLLIYDNAKRRSKMMHWENHRAGSGYLRLEVAI